jgi:hypothetical protein
MKRVEIRKIMLRTETLRVLQGAALGHVAGGGESSRCAIRMPYELGGLVGDGDSRTCPRRNPYEMGG